MHPDHTVGVTPDEGVCGGVATDEGVCGGVTPGYGAMRIRHGEDGDANWSGKRCPAGFLALEMGG